MGRGNTRCKKPWGWRHLGKVSLRKSTEVCRVGEEWGRKIIRWGLGYSHTGHCKPGWDVWLLF
jgi:hypothetical protein